MGSVAEIVQPPLMKDNGPSRRNILSNQQELSTQAMKKYLVKKNELQSSSPATEDLEQTPTISTKSPFYRYFIGEGTETESNQ